MNNYYTTKTSARNAVRREKDPISWRYCMLTLATGLILVGGFFMAARTHFNSIDFGIRNSTLRKQMENLESEKRRLIWQRETVLAPAEIKKAARRLGFTDNVAAVMASMTTPQNAPSQAAAPNAPKVVKATASAEKQKTLVQKTVDSKQVARIAAPKEVSRVQIARN